MSRRHRRILRSIGHANIGRIAPTRTEPINLRGVFSFPIEQHGEQPLTSTGGDKITGYQSLR